MEVKPHNAHCRRMVAIVRYHTLNLLLPSEVAIVRYTLNLLLPSEVAIVRYTLHSVGLPVSLPR